jgi:hypothetical protein
MNLARAAAARAGEDQRNACAYKIAWLLLGDWPKVRRLV